MSVSYIGGNSARLDFTTSVSVTRSITLGNVLYVSASFVTGTSITMSIADTGGHTWNSRVGPINQTANAGRAQAWTTVANQTGSITITITFSATVDFGEVIVAEAHSTIGSGWTHDVSSSGAGVDNGGGGTAQTSAVTTSAQSHIVFGSQHLDRDGGTFSAGTNYTAATGATTIRAFAEHRITSTSASETAPSSNTDPRRWVALLVCMNEQSAAAAVLTADMIEERQLKPIEFISRFQEQAEGAFLITLPALPNLGTSDEAELQLKELPRRIEHDIPEPAYFILPPPSLPSLGTQDEAELQLRTLPRVIEHDVPEPVYLILPPSLPALGTQDESELQLRTLPRVIEHDIPEPEYLILLPPLPFLGTQDDAELQSRWISIIHPFEPPYETTYDIAIPPIPARPQFLRKGSTHTGHNT